ncbi:hypothetical protein MLD38_018595 [Melastoma candidum]|uniref:Uncharacterized protein n=1 Tax=Melastoma candidum TaxID=119954 RepID=A0ACB9QUC9_9MYRT|nr:hypothetical protein MLD38_018595 [Melastoma candidum]
MYANGMYAMGTLALAVLAEEGGSGAARAWLEAEALAVVGVFISWSSSSSSENQLDDEFDRFPCKDIKSRMSTASTLHITHSRVDDLRGNLKNDVAAQDLYQHTHRDPDDDVLYVLVEARRQPKLVPNPREESEQERILKEDEVDEVEDEARAVEPEEVVAKLDDGDALDDLPFLHPWVLKRRNTTANNPMGGLIPTTTLKSSSRDRLMYLWKSNLVWLSDAKCSMMNPCLNVK